MLEEAVLWCHKAPVRQLLRRERNAIAFEPPVAKLFATEPACYVVVTTNHGCFVVIHAQCLKSIDYLGEFKNLTVHAIAKATVAVSAHPVVKEQSATDVLRNDVLPAEQYLEIRPAAENAYSGYIKHGKARVSLR